jgi:hypothetical protein
MENEKHINKEDYTVIKELLTNREKTVEIFLHDFQNSIINFCMNYNMFHKKENFFNLTLSEQFDFNECVEYSANKLKNDFKQMENFYLKCKNKCFDGNPLKSKEMEDMVEKHNIAEYNIMRPNLPSCISECKDLYSFLNLKYYFYMVRDAGIYTELINYKKFV